MSSSIDTLDQVLDYLTKNQIDDDGIYDHVSGIDRSRLERLLKRLQKIEDAPAPKSLKAKRTYEGKRSRLKGRIYEDVMSVMLEGVRCFESWKNVQSTTNELDILIVLGPRASWIHGMRNWGAHCVAECKYHKTHVSTDWVTKLNSVLKAHNARVGMLFSRMGVAKTGRGATIKHQLQLYAVGDSRFIITLDRADLEACVNGKNFVKLIVQRYVEISAGLERLGLAAK